MTSVIHVKTQEEWDIVTKFYNLKWNSNDCFKWYGENSCINYEATAYSPISFYKKDYKIIEFKEWEIINNIKTNNKSMEKQMLDVLTKTYENPILRRTTVPLFMSNPGIGKTTIIQEFANKRGVKMVKITLSQRMPNEVVGMVMPDLQSKSLQVFDSHELLSLNDGDVLFFDEVFNGTLKQTLDALLNLLEDRTLPSGKKLADVLIVAASNPQGLINLTPQIKQRFEKEELKFNAEEYQVYLKNKYGMPESISSGICTLINKEKFESNEWNFVTPRSVEKAINKIGCDLVSNYDDLLLPLLKKTIKIPIDVEKINAKEGDEVEYLNILKALVSGRNQKINEELSKSKNPKNDTKNHKQKSRATADLSN